jgi:hypothetical protein
MNDFLVGIIWGHVGFFLVGFILWGLIAVSGIFFILGLFKKSWKAFLISGVTILVPAIILSTQHGWFNLFYLLPVAAFGFSYFTKKRMNISL